MNNPRLAIRYAKSLIDLAIERKSLPEVHKDILFLKSVCTTNPDFVLVLKSPVIKNDKKVKILEAVTTGRISELTSAFMRLLGLKGRELNLPEIIDAFIDQYNVINNIRKVKLTTAVEIGNDLKQSFITKLQKDNKGEIELESVIDQSIIGGFIIETQGTLVDASISKDLKDIGKQFSNNDYLHKLR
ncbi:MAG: ATP synthase F1 subunit delta [Ginsengibacter sp.]